MSDINIIQSKFPESEGFWKTNTLRVISDDDFSTKCENADFFTHLFESKMTKLCSIKWIYQINRQTIFLTPLNYVILTTYQKHISLPEISPEDYLIIQKYKKKSNRDKELLPYFEEKRKEKMKKEMSIKNEIDKRDRTPLGTFQYISPKNEVYKKKRSMFS